MPEVTQPSLPLTEATFFILLSLSPEPRHGYAILKDVQSLSDGRVALSTGTLYGALDRLLGFGWIERAEADGAAQGRPHKSYRLTESGRHALHVEMNRLDSLLTIARRYVAGTP